MPLGLIPDAWVVLACDDPTSLATGVDAKAASIQDTLLFFTSFQDAKDAAESYIAQFPLEIVGGGTVYCPKYVWVSPIYKLWIDGEN